MVTWNVFESITVKIVYKTDVCTVSLFPAFLYFLLLTMNPRHDRSVCCFPKFSNLYRRQINLARFILGCGNLTNNQTLLWNISKQIHLSFMLDNIAIESIQQLTDGVLDASSLYGFVEQIIPSN